jgi:hypothetical protein
MRSKGWAIKMIEPYTRAAADQARTAPNVMARAL